MKQVINENECLDINTRTTTTTTTNSNWIPYDPYNPEYPWIEPVQPLESYTTTLKYVYTKPDIKTLEIKGKLLFYYWDDQILNYAIYKKGEKLEFQTTIDFLQVLNELGVFE